MLSFIIYGNHHHHHHHDYRHRHHHRHHRHVVQSGMGFAALVLALLCGFVAATPLPDKVDSGGDDDDGSSGDDDDGDGCEDEGKGEGL